MSKRKKIPVVDKGPTTETGQSCRPTGDSNSDPTVESRGGVSRQRDDESQQPVSSDEAKVESAQETQEESAVATQERAEPASEKEIIESLRAQVAQADDKLLRAKAEFANMQRRAATERLEAARLANVNLIRSVLDVIDDFERSLAVEVESDEANNVLTGVRLVYENLMKVLRDHGVSLIEAAGKPFDPNFHEAMMCQPTGEQPPGMVLQEVKKGYQLHDRIIRPAKVIVSAEQPAVDAEPKADAP